VKTNTSNVLEGLELEAIAAGAEQVPGGGGQSR